MTPILKPFPKPITRRRGGALANRGVILRLASILLSACLATGCGDEDPPEPVCNRAFYFSGVSVDLPGFVAAFGADAPFLLDVCPRGLECETVRLRAPIDPAEPLDYSSEPGSSMRCELDESGALHLHVELPYPIDMLEGDRELEIALRREDGARFAEAHGNMHLDLMYKRGEQCGPSNAEGSTEIDAGAWSAVP